MAEGTVLVTGASRGIGKAIALRFAKEHYNVAISCLRNTRRLEKRRSRRSGRRKAGRPVRFPAPPAVLQRPAKRRSRPVSLTPATWAT